MKYGDKSNQKKYGGSYRKQTRSMQKNVTLRNLNVGMKDNISSPYTIIQLSANHLYRHFTQVKLSC